jgi:hypothetical protein
MIVLFLLVIFLVCASLVWLQGLWGAAIALLNSIFAGLIAMTFFPVLAELLEKHLPPYGYFWDFLCFWLLFAVVFSILRLVANLLSQYQVRFKTPVEMAGRSVLAMLTAWLMVCIVCFSLHIAPLPVNSFGGSFQAQEGSNDLLGVAPDKQWLSLVHSCSLGSLSTLSRGNQFNSPTQFIKNYRLRREELQELQNDTDSPIKKRR